MVVVVCLWGWWLVGEIDRVGRRKHTLVGSIAVEQAKDLEDVGLGAIASVLVACAVEAED